MNKLQALIATLLIGTAVSAQSPLISTWVMKEKQHILGPNYENALPKKITLLQQKDSLIIESIFDEDGKDVSSRQAVAMNGKPSTKTSSKSNRKYTRSLKWSGDKKSLVLTTVIYVAGNPNEVDLTRIETLSLSPEGKQLILNKKSVETRSENWETNGVYARFFTGE